MWVIGYIQFAMKHLDLFYSSDTFISFCSQKKLTTLDIAANRIKKIENISHLTELQEFWVCNIYQAASGTVTAVICD